MSRTTGELPTGRHATGEFPAVRGGRPDDTTGERRGPAIAGRDMPRRNVPDGPVVRNRYEPSEPPADSENTGRHGTVGATPPQDAPPARSRSERGRTWRDGPREDAAWRDTSRRESPRRRRGASPPAPPAEQPQPVDETPSATIVSIAGRAARRAAAEQIDSTDTTTRSRAARRAAEARAVEEQSAITTDEMPAVRTRAARRRVSASRDFFRRDSRDAQGREQSTHREARNRRATSRDLPHAQDTGPRRHRKLERRRLGIGISVLAVVAAIGATSAIGFALSRPDASTPVASKAASAKSCATTGPGQRDVEAYLATRAGRYGRVDVDGRQSAIDCAAIASFQRWAQVPTRTGFADATTGFLARQLGAIRYDQCQAPGDRLTVCVDLTNQAMWVVQSGRIMLGPTAIRSGQAGQETPAGSFKITDKQLREVGQDGVEQPYYAEFLDDIGFHTANKPMYGAVSGSTGINLLDRDAKALYRLTELGTAVNIFGRKPGT